MFTTSPGEWPLSYVGCGSMDSLISAGQAELEQIAIEYLWRWTGRQFGTTTVEIPPCRDSNAGRGDVTYSNTPRTSPSWRPVLVQGSMRAVGCGVCGASCSCANSYSILLPGPVSEILEVWIDGELLPDSAYVLTGTSQLNRVDGDTWPTEADQTLPIDSVGTWGIKYSLGIPVPMGGQVAAGRLAIEFAKAVTGDSSCQLPQRLQSMSRQGVSIAVLDSFDDIDKGHTGIWIVDSWVASVMRPNTQSAVMSPDLRERRSRRVL